MSRLDQSLERMLRLAEAARDLLCQRNEPVALRYAADALGTTLASLLWEQRGQDAVASVPPISDADRSLRTDLLDSSLRGLSTKDDRGMYAALRIGTGFTYALQDQASDESLAALDRILQDHVPEVVDTEEEALLLLRLASNVHATLWQQSGPSISVDHLDRILAAGARCLGARSTDPENGAELLDRAARMCRFAMISYQHHSDGTLPARWWRVWRERLLDEVLTADDQRIRTRRPSVIHLLKALAEVSQLENELKEEASALALEQTRKHLVDLKNGRTGAEGGEISGESLTILSDLLPTADMPQEALEWTADRLRQQILQLSASVGPEDSHSAQIGNALIAAWTDLALSGKTDPLTAGTTELWETVNTTGSPLLAEVAAETASLALVLLPADDARAEDLVESALSSDWRMASDSLSRALEELVAVIIARRERQPAALNRFLDQTETLIMHSTTRANIDQRIARILSDRLSEDLDRLEGEEASDEASDEAVRERCLESYDRILRLSARGTVRPSLDILERLVDALPSNHPRRAELRRRHQRSRSSAGPRLLPRSTQPLDPSAISELSNRLLESSTDPAWPLPPFFRAPWRALEGEELVDAIAQLAVTLPAHGALKADQLLERSVRARRVELPFYTGWTALEILVATDDGFASSVAVESEEQVMMLWGTSPPIHLLNEEIPVVLDTPEKAEAYLRFFCGAVHGEEGPFRIVNEPEDLLPLWAFQAETEVPKVAERLKPLSVEPLEDGFWKVTTSVLYSNALFESEFRIHPTGMVEMVGDSPLATDLPVISETFSEELRRFRILEATALEEELRTLQARLAEITVPPWPLPPLITTLGEWQENEIEGTARAVVEYAQALPKGHALSRETLIEQAVRSRRQQLPFYEGWSAVEILLQVNEELASVMYLDSESALVVLDGTSSPFHAQNRDCPIRIDGPEEASAYLELFCNVVQAEGSPFRIVRTPDDLPNHALPESLEALRQEAGDQIRTLTVDQDDEGNWLAEASLLYLRDLILASFRIQPSGEVVMLDDELLADELPVYSVRVENSVRRIEVVQ